MAQSRTKRAVITAAIVFAILIGVIGVILLIRSQGSQETDTKDTSQVDTQPAPAVNDEDQPATTPIPDSEEPVVKPDAENFTSIAIEPLAINVFYSKGTGPLEFAVLRTPGGTRFVEFRAPGLVGTKCTDDAGAFASIIEDPRESDSTTLAESVKVGTKTYGLSLATEACTGDASLLVKYQAGFRDGLPLLSAIE